MYRNKYNTFLTVVLVILLILILGVVGFIGYEYFYKKYKSASDAAEQIAEFDKYINDNKGIVIDLDEDNDNENQNNITTGGNSNGNSQTKYNPNKKYGLKYRGYGVLGKIELPKVGLQYPVLETMTNANSIDVSVAVQYGVRTKRGWKYSNYRT